MRALFLSESLLRAELSLDITYPHPSPPFSITVIPSCEHPAPATEARARIIVPLFPMCISDILDNSIYSRHM